MWKLGAGAFAANQLPFPDLGSIEGLVVDTASNVYVATDHNKVLKLAAGATTPTQLPITGHSIGALAIDGTDNVYVATDYPTHVFKLAAGATTPIEVVNLGDLNPPPPGGFAVDTRAMFTSLIRPNTGC